jgi:hypothetical protein
MFHSNKIYIQIFRNRVTVVNLNDGTESTCIAVVPFSTRRSVLSRFDPADKAVREAIRGLRLKPGLFKTQGLIQQMEDTEGGLTDIEQRALRDLAEQSGVTRVSIIDGERQLSVPEALYYLENQKSHGRI